MPCSHLHITIAAVLLAAGLTGLAPAPAAAIDLWERSGYAPPQVDLDAARATVAREQLRHLSRRLDSQSLSLEVRRRALNALPQNGPVAAQTRALDRRLDRLEDAQRRIDRGALLRSPLRRPDTAAVAPDPRFPLLPSAGGLGMAPTVPTGSADASETARLFVERLLRQNDARVSAQ